MRLHLGPLNVTLDPCSMSQSGSSASTRSDTRFTSVMSCSTISTVTPRSVRMSRIQNDMSSVSSTLRPEEGSSSRISLGSEQRARATSTTLRTP